MAKGRIVTCSGAKKTRSQSVKELLRIKVSIEKYCVRIIKQNEDLMRGRRVLVDQ